MIMSPTSQAFSIESPSATGEFTRKVSQSLFVIGALAIMMGNPSSAREVREASPSAARPPIAVLLAEDENQKGYRQTDDVERSIGRLKAFAKYRSDWDAHGSAAPDSAAINVALQYLTLLEPWHPRPLATLSRSGEPVLEFVDSASGLFGSVRFVSDRSVELYLKEKDSPSLFFEGDLASPEVNAFLSDQMKLPTT
jgi:hypothetical protein